jgi:hypothetical protein
MHRFSISSQCVCFLIGILVSIFLPVGPSSAQNVHGADVTLAWDPNPEANLAGYKVYYGSASGNYSFMVDVGNWTSLTISGLEAGKTYYFAATAYGPAGEESGMSDELRYDTPKPNSNFLSPTKASGDTADYTIPESAGPNGSISSSGNVVFRRRISDKLRYDTPRPDSNFLSPTKASDDTASYTINASAGPNGSISSSGNIAVSRGSSKTFIIRPNWGYRIARVNVDGVSMNYVTSHTFTHINANHTIRAEFESIWNKKRKTDMTPSNPSQ